MLRDAKPANKPIMILSTQTPSAEKQSRSKSILPGCTGKNIQALTGGGFVYLHHDKKIKTAEEQQQFTNHLVSNGLLIITGHGKVDKAELSLAGLYRSPVGLVTDITCSANEYVDLILQSGALKKGDHINVLLYVCYGALSIDNHSSLAEKFGLALAAKGISSTIIASDDLVSRIKNTDPLFGDIKGQQLRFRAQARTICLLTTYPDLAHHKHRVIREYTDKYIYITKEGLQFVSAPIFHDEDYLSAILKLKFGLSREEIMTSLPLDAKAAAAKLNDENLQLVVRKSQTYPGSLVVTYRNHAKQRIEQVLCFMIKDQDGHASVALNDEELAMLQHKAVSHALLQDSSREAKIRKKYRGFALFRAENDDCTNEADLSSPSLKRELE